MCVFFMLRQLSCAVLLPFLSRLPTKWKFQYLEISHDQHTIHHQHNCKCVTFECYQRPTKFVSIQTRSGHPSQLKISIATILPNSGVPPHGPTEPAALFWTLGHRTPRTLLGLTRCYHSMHNNWSLDHLAASNCVDFQKIWPPWTIRPKKHA